MTRLLLAGLLLSTTACAAFESKSSPRVMPFGPAELTVSPPARITFDDIEPTGRGFRPIFGSADSIHRGDGACCVYGRCRGSRSPAVVDVGMVFDAMGEYRRLQSSGMPPESAEYILSLARVNEEFGRALGQYLHDCGLYDTVFPRGLIRIRKGSKIKGIPDITGEILQRLRS